MIPLVKNKEGEGCKALPSLHNPCHQLLSSDFPSTTLPTMFDQPASKGTEGNNLEIDKDTTGGNTLKQTSVITENKTT